MIGVEDLTPDVPRGDRQQREYRTQYDQRDDADHSPVDPPTRGLLADIRRLPRPDLCDLNAQTFEFGSFVCVETASRFALRAHDRLRHARHRSSATAATAPARIASTNTR
ncbi:Uncharacterised protein [Mycobacteroides abscessus subsp. abscessus]|nr:Uncharacterised protein [Mycobacteroides abscessus subsp. abscessus]